MDIVIGACGWFHQQILSPLTALLRGYTRLISHQDSRNETFHHGAGKGDTHRSGVYTHTAAWQQ